MIKEEASADNAAYSVVYHLTKTVSGVTENIGAAIQIAKDMVAKSGSVKTCTEKDVPVEGYQVGDKYINLVLANSGGKHLYILVTDLIDVYTAGTGIAIKNNEISINSTTLDRITTVETNITNLGNSKQDNITVNPVDQDSELTDLTTITINNVKYNVGKRSISYKC